MGRTDASQRHESSLRDLATYPADHAAKQIGWIAHALEVGAATLAFEAAAGYRRRVAPGRSSLRPISDVRPSSSWTGPSCIRYPDSAQ
jgi:hypothetical protein